MNFLDLFRKPFQPLDRIETPSAYDTLIQGSDDPADQRRMERAFFESIKLRNGVTKMTYEDRMTDVDDWLMDFLAREEKLNILDVGISSGVTTLELAERLDAESIDYDLTGIDLNVDVYLLTFRDGSRVLTDGTKFPIHFEIDGKGFGYVKGTNVFHLAKRYLLKKRTERVFSLNGAASPSEKETKSGNVKIERTKLICRKLADHSKIRVFEGDVLSDFPGRQYDLVRAANILNLSYFSSEQLAAAVGNLRSKMKADGQLLVCRTDENDRNEATLFKLENGRFAIAARFNSGSEIEQSVLQA